MAESDRIVQTERATLLRTIGLQEDVANQISSNYDPDFDPRADLWDYVKEYVLTRRRTDNVSEEDYEEELRSCGLSTSVARLHMDPQFKDLRMMEEPWFWALDTLRSRLEVMDFCPSSTSENEPIDGSDGDSGRQSRRNKSSVSGKGGPASQKGAEKGQSSVETSGKTTESSRNEAEHRLPMDDEVVWYKGGIRAQFSPYYNEATRRITHSGIPSLPPTDFNAVTSCLYYTDSLDCATHYAAWAARRSGGDLGSERAILCIYVAKPWLESLRTAGEVRYLTTPEFQELVWWSYRSAEHILDTPDHVRETRQSQLIIGPINAHAPSKVRRLQASEVESATFGGQKAWQICVSLMDSNREVIRKLDSFEASLI